MLIRLVAGARPLSLRVFAPLSSVRPRLHNLIGSHGLSTDAKGDTHSKSPQPQTQDNLSHAYQKDLSDVAAFCRSVADREEQDIRLSYDRLASRFEDPTKDFAQTVMHADSLVEALKVLASTRQYRWTQGLMDRILSDLTTHFRQDINPQLHDAIIKGFLHGGNIRRALRWLLDMPSKAGNCTPTREQWNMLLVQCNDIPLASTVLESMRNSSHTITISTYRALFEGLRRRARVPALNLVQEWIQAMKKDKVPYDHSLKKLISGIYTEADLPDLALEARIMYETSLSLPMDRLPMPLQTEVQADINLYLARIAERQGNSAAVDYYRKLSFTGFKASMKTLMALLDRATEPSSVKFWANTLGLDADAAAWARVISNAAARGLLPVALTSYRMALDSGVLPTNAMLHPILRSLCSGSLRPPSNAMIDRALSLFQDYMRFHEEASRDGSQPTDASTPDAPTYNTLIRALTSSKEKSKYQPIAVSLLEDMQARNVPMDSMTTTSLVVIFMQLSTNVSELFAAYNNICRSEQGRWKLDGEGYVVVLNTFCELSTTMTGYPSTRLYMEIVKDMRMAGYPITGKVYTIILRHLAVLAGKLVSPGERDRLALSIRRVHNFISVGASLAPDTALWNQLMDTYQRCGCYGEALLVWDSLYISQQHDNASVSIVLDTCAYANAYEVASRIWLKLKADGFPLNLRNWNNWLECLCRLRRIDEAAKVLCVEMGRGGNVAPTVESARIVLKFATAERDTVTRTKIREYRPDLWNKLPKELQVGKTSV